MQLKRKVVVMAGTIAAATILAQLLICNHLLKAASFSTAHLSADMTRATEEALHVQAERLCCQFAASLLEQSMEAPSRKALHESKKKGGGREKGMIGSSPPECKEQCRPCNPCVRVIVPIRSTSALPNEYYPEAWRCQCGTNQYDP